MNHVFDLRTRSRVMGRGFNDEFWTLNAQLCSQWLQWLDVLLTIIYNYITLMALDMLKLCSYIMSKEHDHCMKCVHKKIYSAPGQESRFFFKSAYTLVPFSNLQKTPKRHLKTFLLSTAIVHIHHINMYVLVTQAKICDVYIVSRACDQLIDQRSRSRACV